MSTQNERSGRSRPRPVALTKLLECPETVKALVSAELRQTVQIADLLAVEKAACYIAPALIAVLDVDADRLPLMAQTAHSPECDRLK